MYDGTFWSPTAPQVGRLSLASTDLLRQLPPEALVSIFSILRVLPGNESAAGRFMGWAVLAVILYDGARFIAPDDLRKRGRVGFQMLFSAVSVSYAVTITDAITGTSEPIPFVGWVFGIFLVSSVLFVAQFYYLTEWRLLDADGEMAAFLDAVILFDVESEIERDFGRSGWQSILGVGLWCFEFGVLFSVVCFLFGLASAQIGLMFPIPDLLLVGTAVFTSASNRDAGVRNFDFEAKVHRLVGLSTESQKEIFLLLVVLLGLVVSVQPVLAFSVGFAGLLELAILAWPTVAVTTWNVVGIFALLVASASYGLWFWIRELERLPAFLTTRNENGSGTATDAPPRLPGLTGLPTLTLLGSVLLNATLSTPSGGVQLFSAVAWPFLLGIVITVTYLEVSGRRENCSYRFLDAGHEDLVAAIAVVVQLWGVAVAGNVSLLASGNVVAGLVDPAWVIPAVLIVSTMYLPDVVPYRRKASGVAKYAMSAFLIVLGVTVLCIALITGYREPLLGLYAGVCILGVILIATVDHFEY